MEVEHYRDNTDLLGPKDLFSANSVDEASGMMAGKNETTMTNTTTIGGDDSARKAKPIGADASDRLLDWLTTPNKGATMDASKVIRVGGNHFQQVVR